MSLRVQNPLLAARFKAEKNTRVSAAFGGVRSFTAEAFGQLAGNKSPDMVSAPAKRLAELQAEIDMRDGLVDGCTALFAELERFEPTEEEIQDMYANRDMEDTFAILTHESW